MSQPVPSIFSTEALRALGAVGLAHAVAAIDHRRVHRPGADAVDADVVLAVIDRHRLGEPDHRRLGRRVGREAARPQRRDRGDVDDRAALGGLDHRRDRVLGEQEHRLDVDLHDAAVFLGLLVDHAAAAADADIVVEEVEPAPAIDRGVDQPLAVGFLGGVAGLGDGGAALGLDHLDGALRPASCRGRRPRPWCRRAPAGSPPRGRCRCRRPPRRRPRRWPPCRPGRRPLHGPGHLQRHPIRCGRHCPAGLM